MTTWFIFLSACDVTVRAVRAPVGLGLQEPLLFSVLGKEAEGTPLPRRQAEAAPARCLMCGCACACVTTGGPSDVAGREAGNVTFSKQN